MSEPTSTAPPVEDRQSDDPSARTIPYERFAEVNRRAKDAEGKLRDLQGRLEEIENKEKSELERERQARQAAVQEREQLEKRITHLERSAWVRAAAADAKFEDPSDAVAFADLELVETEKDAERLVKDLAKRKPRLLRAEEPVVPPGQVLHDGQRVDQQSLAQPGQPAPVTSSAGPVVPGQFTPEQEVLLRQIQGAQQSAGWTSSPLVPGA